MANDHKLLEARILDVGYRRLHPAADSCRSEVAGLASAARQVNGENIEIRFQVADFVDG
jgi:hypothetical protein